MGCERTRERGRKWLFLLSRFVSRHARRFKRGCWSMNYLLKITQAKTPVTCCSFLRGGPFECHPELISISNENDGSDTSDQTDPASEEANSESDAEWENLSTNLVHTTDTSTHQGSLSQSTSPQASRKSDEPATAASLVSSAAASVAALWPWKK